MLFCFLQNDHRSSSVSTADGWSGRLKAVVRAVYLTTSASGHHSPVLLLHHAALHETLRQLIFENRARLGGPSSELCAGKLCVHRYKILRVIYSVQSIRSRRRLCARRSQANIAMKRSVVEFHVHTLCQYRNLGFREEDVQVSILRKVIIKTKFSNAIGSQQPSDSSTMSVF